MSVFASGSVSVSVVRGIADYGLFSGSVSAVQGIATSGLVSGSISVVRGIAPYIQTVIHKSYDL